MKEEIAFYAKNYQTERKDFDKLYLSMYNGLKGFVYKFVQDDDVIKDIISVTMCVVHVNIDKYDETLSEFNTWVYSIAKNEALTYINKKKKHISIDVLNKEDRKQFTQTSENQQTINIGENKLQKIFSMIL